MIDPARAALNRYLPACIRAELRARALWERRRARVEAAQQQIREYDAAGIVNVEEMVVRARTASRRNRARTRTR